MKHSIRNTAAVVLASVVLVITFSRCKENTIINSNLVPTVDNINTFQFDDNLLTLKATTIIDDSVVTSYNVSPVYAGLGSVNDPFFGFTHEGLYFQFGYPSGFNLTNTDIDSAALIIPYSGFSWGDTTSTSPALNYTVYRVMDTLLNLDSNFYSFKRFNVNATPVSALNVPVALKTIKDPFNLGTGVDSGRFLRIKLNNDFKTILIDTINYGFSDQPSFIKQFNGLFVLPDTNNTAAGGVINYFKLDGSTLFGSAGIIFYHHDTVRKAMSLGFNTQYTAHSTWVKRNYPGTLAKAIIDDTISQKYVLLQNEPGAAIDITISHLDLIPKSLINKAEIVLTMIDTLNPTQMLIPPNNLYPVGVDDNGGLYTIADRYPLTSTAPLDYIDASKKAVTVGSTTYFRYSINFPRELQKAITAGRTTLHLRINGTQTFVGAYRLIAGGKTHGDANSRLKLNIIYSKLN